MATTMTNDDDGVTSHFPLAFVSFVSFLRHLRLFLWFWDFWVQCFFTGRNTASCIRHGQVVWTSFVLNMVPIRFINVFKYPFTHSFTLSLDRHFVYWTAWPATARCTSPPKVDDHWPCPKQHRRWTRRRFPADGPRSVEGDRVDVSIPACRRVGDQSGFWQPGEVLLRRYRLLQATYK